MWIVNVPVGVSPRFLLADCPKDPVVPQPVNMMQTSPSRAPSNRSRNHILAFESRRLWRITSTPNGKMNPRLATNRDLDRSELVWDGPVVVKTKARLAPSLLGCTVTAWHPTPVGKNRGSHEIVNGPDKYPVLGARVRLYVAG